MIPVAFITEWRKHAPWSQDAWVEQDLVISRALVEIFRVPAVAERLAFRGGTALHKLHLSPAVRYSEDIDLVQVAQEPIGETLDLLRAALDPWLGEPRRVRKKGRVNLLYRFKSEDSPAMPLRLKIEINSREHFTELGYTKVPFQIANRWFTGEAELTTFDLNELLATKLRALYQRKKGRDLFDLSYSIERDLVDVGILLDCFKRYMNEDGHAVSRAQFEANLDNKARDPSFRGDLSPLLRPAYTYDFDKSMALVLKRLIRRLPGDPWKGNGLE